MIVVMAQPERQFTAIIGLVNVVSTFRHRQLVTRPSIEALDGVVRHWPSWPAVDSSPYWRTTCRARGDRLLYSTNEPASVRYEGDVSTLLSFARDHDKQKPFHVLAVLLLT